MTQRQRHSAFRKHQMMRERRRLLRQVAYEPLEGRYLMALLDYEPHPILFPGSTPLPDAFGRSGDPNAFQSSARWTSTATNPGPLGQGDPTTITWSIIADGVNIPGFAGESAADSNLIATLDGIYGSAGGPLSNRPWFPQLRSVFDRWSAVSGINYVYEPNDDSAAFAAASVGILGVRGDVRIGGHTIDGNSGILAYNFFPDNGDMVIDTGDNFYNDTSQNSRGLRNVTAHEAGHGLGLSHVCPINETK